MNLEKSILNAIDLSRRLEAALKVDDMDLCGDLLEIRGEAMAAFETIHRASSAAQKEHCHILIEELVSADRSLQDRYEKALEASAGEFRQSLTSGSGIPVGAYNSTPAPACVDRKA
jgi:hypothetical protein